MLHREVLQPRSWLPMIALGLVSSGLALIWVAAMTLCLASCAEVKSAGGEVGGTLAEWTICPLEISSLITCGHVVQCSAMADTPSGFVELCLNDSRPEQLDEVNSLYGPCDPTPRHEGLCNWHCDGGAGCNAYSGCWGCE